MQPWRASGLRIGLFAVAVACAALLAALRLFTCVVVLADDPTSIFALKRHPSLASIAYVGDAPPRRDYVLLDDDENQLVYEAPYLFLTGHAALLGGAFLGFGVAVLAWPRRHPGAPS